MQGGIETGMKFSLGVMRTQWLHPAPLLVGDTIDMV